MVGIWGSLSCCMYRTCRDGIWQYGQTSTLSCVCIGRGSKGPQQSMKSPKKSLLTQPSALFPRHKAFKVLLPETPALGGQNDTGEAAGTWVVAERLEYLKQHQMPILYPITQAPASQSTEIPPAPLNTLGFICLARDWTPSTCMDIYVQDSAPKRTHLLPTCPDLHQQRPSSSLESKEKR